MKNKFYLWQKILSKFGLGESEKTPAEVEIEQFYNREIKENFDFDKTAIRLLETLEKENKKVRDFLIKNYKRSPTSLKMEENARSYFISHSVFTAATVANPGSSVITELLYEEIEKLNLPSPIDRYFLCSKAGKAVKARLQVIEEELLKTIEEYRRKGEVLIGNLGSGPSRDIIDVLSTYYQNASNIKAFCIDKDSTALMRGKRMAIIKGVDHLIEFIEGSFLKYNPMKKFDIVLLIGILCPLKSEICIRILKIIRKLLKKGSCLIASNVSKKMLEEDPFACFLMERIGNWKFVFKNEKELKEIFEKSGYEWKRSFTDPYGFHIMGVGAPRFYF